MTSAALAVLCGATSPPPAHGPDRRLAASLRTRDAVPATKVRTARRFLPTLASAILARHLSRDVGSEHSVTHPKTHLSGRRMDSDPTGLTARRRARCSHPRDSPPKSFAPLLSVSPPRSFPV